MSRYFFHLYDGSILLDEEGIELSDACAAKDMAIAAATDIIRARGVGQIKPDHWIAVVDSENSPVFTLPFRSALGARVWLRDPSASECA
jgi:hypothetical protein